MKLPSYLLASCLALTSASHAAIIYSENFDGLNVGSLVNQGGWTQNNPGSIEVSDTCSQSGPNSITIGSGGAAQHLYTPVDLATDSSSISFSFLSTTTTAGRNIQLSLRSATSGSDSVFYLNLLGNGSGIHAGVNASNYTSYSFDSTLSTNTWYAFNATTDPLTKILRFTVTAQDGNTLLTSGEIDLSGTTLVTPRLVFSSNSGTQSGDWYIDNLQIATIPEPGTMAMALGGAALLTFLGRHTRRKE